MVWSHGNPWPQPWEFAPVLARRIDRCRSVPPRHICARPSTGQGAEVALSTAPAAGTTRRIPVGNRSGPCRTKDGQPVSRAGGDRSRSRAGVPRTGLGSGEGARGQPSRGIATGVAVKTDHHRARLIRGVDVCAQGRKRASGSGCVGVSLSHTRSVGVWV
jgi:hypothetical protein